MELFDVSLTELNKALDLRAANHRIIASNLANVDTPGFTAQRLDFEASMQEAMAQPESPTAPVVEASPAIPFSLDGNNVDLDTELSQLGRNKMMYSITSQLMSAKFRQLAGVIDGQ